MESRVFQGGGIVTKLLPFEYRIYIIFDIELTNQATMSVAGRRRTISSTTWDLKGQRENRGTLDTGSLIL